MATDQISFSDQSLKKQIEGYLVSDGRQIHVSVSYGALGPVIDYNSQVLLVRKLLSELARDPSGGSNAPVVAENNHASNSSIDQGGGKRRRLSS
jgi:hypothetical protein